MIRNSCCAGLLFARMSLALLAGCTMTHDKRPQTGSETGNPPVLDVALVALVVTADEVHVIGMDGAVSPGNVDVEAVSTLSARAFRGHANAQGAFDLEVDAAPSDAFEVRAVHGDERSQTVYVVRGGASVSEAQADGLSCMQRGDLSRGHMNDVAETADQTCTSDDDCQVVPLATACSDACSDAIVSAQGKSALEAARSDIEDGLCREFESDGCTVLALPCPGPTLTKPACVSGSCTFVADLASTPACTASYDEGTGDSFDTVYFHIAPANVCAPRVFKGTGGNENHYATRAACEAACGVATDACAPNRKFTTVCVAGGDLIGCVDEAPACALVCSQASDCANDSIGTRCNTDNVCDAFGLFSSPS